MTLSIPISGWGVAVLLTVLMWSAFGVWLHVRDSGGMFDFMPALGGAACLAATAALWIGLFAGMLL